MNRLSAAELRRSPADVLNRTESLGERVIIRRKDKDVAAIIPAEDLRLLERLVREEEDRNDATAALAAREESEGRIPFDDVRRKLGMTDQPRDRVVPHR